MSMQLLPSRAGLYEYTSIDLVIRDINKHAKDQGYAVTRKRSKRSKKGVLMKTWIRCDRGGEEDAKGHGHRITSSKRVDCPFECIAKLQFNQEDENGLGDWILTVEHADHNHLPTKPSASVVQRNTAMQDSLVLHEIRKEFRKGSKASSVLKGIRMDEDGEDSIFKPASNLLLLSHARASLRELWGCHVRIRYRSDCTIEPTVES